MKVFKFGGASIKDANAIRHVGQILSSYKGEELVIVISALGKTTNHLEKIVELWWQEAKLDDALQVLIDQHLQIVSDLFENAPTSLLQDLDNLSIQLRGWFAKPLPRNFDFVYDQVVSFGELFSTKIVSAYLNDSGLFPNRWMDSRSLIITDDLYREARLDWTVTTRLIQSIVKPIVEQMPVLMQGFIGSTAMNTATTLGREGSDYTAAILAYALDAQELVIWKDVPGVMNADPRRVPEAQLFSELTYEQAIEMTYFGATVLHPKSIKPIQNKNIPLVVRSFVHTDMPGTTISSHATAQTDLPTLIIKDGQVFISISSRDFSFITENHLARILDWVVQYGIKVNAMANTAISFRMAVEASSQKLQDFCEVVQKEFELHTIAGLQLITLQYATDAFREKYILGKEILMESRQGYNEQYLVLA